MMSDSRPTNDTTGAQPPSRDLLLGLLLGCVVGAVIPTVLMRGREQSGPAELAVLRATVAQDDLAHSSDSLAPPESGPVGFAEFLPPLSPAERRLEQALDKLVTLNFTDSLLTEVATFFGDDLSVNVVLDTSALADAGIATDTPITRQIRDVTARSVLKLILEPLSLAAVIDNEVLRITTREKAAEILITRTYPISDLCRVPDDWQSFIRAIQEETSGPWNEVDGDGGTITEVAQTGSLVVRQSWAVQGEVLSLIRRQREAQRRMVPAKSMRSNPRGQFP